MYQQVESFAQWNRYTERRPSSKTKGRFIVCQHHSQYALTTTTKMEWKHTASHSPYPSEHHYPITETCTPETKNYSTPWPAHYPITKSALFYFSHPSFKRQGIKRTSASDPYNPHPSPPSSKPSSHPSKTWYSSSPSWPLSCRWCPGWWCRRRSRWRRRGKRPETRWWRGRCCFWPLWVVSCACYCLSSRVGSAIEVWWLLPACWWLVKRVRVYISVNEV